MLLSISNVSVHVCNDCVQVGGSVVFMEVEHLPNSGVVLQCLHAMGNGDIKKVELASINVHATNLYLATKACLWE